MKILNKFILPLFIGLILLSVYVFYFSSFKGLGSFESFDPYRHVKKEILVKLVNGLGIQKSENNKPNIFYVEDKQGVQMLITTNLPLPVGFEKAEKILLTGHLCGGNFEVVEIQVE